MIKRIRNIKRLVAFMLLAVLLFTLVGCSGKENQSGTKQNEDELYSKAMAILDDLGEDQRVKDFLSAYELLMTLPSNEDKFVSQLNEINDIFEKYNIELNSGDYYLNPTVTVTKDGVEKYRTKGAYYDANDLLNAIVYPVLFEKYGDAAQCIDELTAEKVIAAIKSTNEYTFDEKEEQYDSCTEIWEYVGLPKSKYEVKYHSNGLVQSVDIPVVRSIEPYTDDDYTAFFDKDVETQKQIAGSRFISLNNRVNLLSTGYEVLSQIFTDEEIIVISNYIHSLTVEDIWKRNFMAYEGEPTSYAIALVIFEYNDRHISLHYGLNDITLKVTGNNDVNPLTHRWYTLWCGLCLPDGKETIITYSDYINNNIAANDIVQDYSYDLAANADKYAEAPVANTEQQGSNNQGGDVQQSTPVEMSMSETITAYGVIERNDTAFPTFRLRLNTKLTIIFDEYGSDKVFECEYLYFYDEAELNGNYPLEDFVGDSCEVTALLEDYRGGNELFLLNPIITMN